VEAEILTHELPTHVSVAQPLLRLGPLRLDVTALVKLASGCLLGAWIWQLHAAPFALRAAGVAAIVVGTLLLVAARPAGQPLEAWVLPLLLYAVRPRLFVWRSRAADHPWASAAAVSVTTDGGWYRLTAIRVGWASRRPEDPV
jgi:hypothetical protein